MKKTPTEQLQGREGRSIPGLLVVDRIKEFLHCSDFWKLNQFAATSAKDERFTKKQSPANISQGDIYIQFCIRFQKRYNTTQKRWDKFWHIAGAPVREMKFSA